MAPVYQGKVDIKGSQPKVSKARPIPYTMTPKVEVELKRLERDGILHMVKFSDWPTPEVSTSCGRKPTFFRICS